MSAARSSSSGVRDLRAMFENKTDATPNPVTTPDRGRSPSGRSTSGGDVDGPNSKPSSESRTRKVRSSFVSVNPSGQMAAAGTSAGSTETPRRESFSMSDDKDGEAIAEMRKTVSNEMEQRKSIPNLPETVPEQAATSALPTPSIESSQAQKPMVIPSKEKEPRPDKPISADEDDSAVMKPADVKESSVVSEGKGLTPTMDENITKASEPTTSSGAASTPTAAATKPTTNAKHSPKLKSEANAQESAGPAKTRAERPAALSAKPATTKVTPPKASPGIKSPPAAKSTEAPKSSDGTAEQSTAKASVSSDTKAKPKQKTQDAAGKASPATKPTPTSAPKKPQSITSPASKSPRGATKPAELPSHLTAPTASSAAKHEKQESSTSPTAKAHREPTKPVQLPSRLTAPTSSSAAKHEPDSSKDSAKAHKKPSELPSRLLAPTAASQAKHEEPAAPSRKPRSSLPPRQFNASTTSTAGSQGRNKPPSSTRTSLAGGARPNGAAKSSAAPSEGFLARMMKPTAASAKKTHEKAEGQSQEKKRNSSGSAGKPPRRSSEHSASSNKANGVKHPKSSSANVTSPTNSATQQMDELPSRGDANPQFLTEGGAAPATPSKAATGTLGAMTAPPETPEQSNKAAQNDAAVSDGPSMTIEQTPKFDEAVIH
ncbi:MAG: hypothetical protein M1828_002284 [Chrysothrix sp. TS-e1954]|nr:MAG: hypothetical protein M1828_002284 [Chrysothrix sp. TS-e1954]